MFQDIVTAAPDLSKLHFETMEVAKRGNILDVWLNRPKRRNAWNARMHHEMEEMVVNYAEDDADIKVIVVRGRGPVFSAGHDLYEVAAGYASVGKPGLSLAAACYWGQWANKFYREQPVSGGILPGHLGYKWCPDFRAYHNN